MSSGRQPHVPLHAGPVPEATKMHVRYWIFRQASNDYIATQLSTHPDITLLNAYLNEFYPFPEETKR